MPTYKCAAIITFLIFGISTSAFPESSPFVISIDKNENAYLNNELVSNQSWLTEAILKADRPIIYIRTDKDVRAEALAHALEAAKKASINRVWLGQPSTLTKTLPLNLSTAFSTFNALPVTTWGVVGSWSVPNTTIDIYVDFDGTIKISSAGTVKIGPTQMPVLTQMLRQSSAGNSGAKVYIGWDRLAKVDSVDRAVAASEAAGMTDVTLVYQQDQ